MASIPVCPLRALTFPTPLDAVNVARALAQAVRFRFGAAWSWEAPNAILTDAPYECTGSLRLPAPPQITEILDTAVWSFSSDPAGGLFDLACQRLHVVGLRMEKHSPIEHGGPYVVRVCQLGSEDLLVEGEGATFRVALARALIELEYLPVAEPAMAAHA